MARELTKEERALRDVGRAAKNHFAKSAKEAADADVSVTGHLWQIMSFKGGAGKTFLASVLIAFALAEQRKLRIVQVERTAQLKESYPDITEVVAPPTTEALRADGLAGINAFEIWGKAIERAARNGETVITDVGSGLLTQSYLEFLGKSRAGARLTQLQIGTTTFLILPADPVGLAQAVELGNALEVVHPGARIVPVINLHLGRYSVAKASPVWRESVGPFLEGRTVLTMAALDADIWRLFEDQRRTFHDVVHADEETVMRWFNTGWTTAATLHGEISSWLDELWTHIEPIVGSSVPTGSSNNA